MCAVKLKPGYEGFAEIDKLNFCTDRFNMLKEEYINAQEHIAGERSRIVTDSWKETEGQPLDIRRGKLFAAIMEKNPVVIWDGELVAGAQSKYRFGTSPYVDYNPQVAIENLQADEDGCSGSSSVKDAFISEEDRKTLLEDVEYWKGKSTGDFIKQVEEEKIPWLEDWAESGVTNVGTMGNPPAVRTVDYGKIIEKGAIGVIEEAKAAMAALEFGADAMEDLKKENFLKGVVIALEGFIQLGKRYSALAAELAAKESDPKRKAELQRIADACANVPEKPATTFFEAVQCFWLTHIAVNLEVAFLAESPGRMDQYLYPLYEKDVIVEKTMSREEAGEILACLYIKFNQQACVKMSYDKKNIPGTHLQDVTICGVDKNGFDASNELSYLMLEVLGQTGMPQPPIYIRYHNKINREVWMKGLEVNARRGDGNPALLNDEPRIMSFLNHGISLEDARDWTAAGCAGSIIPKYALHGGSMGMNYINMAKIFEYVLNDGKDPGTGKQIGLHTGDPAEWTSIDQYVDAFKKQFDFIITKITQMARYTAFVDAANYHMPFCSALIGDCIGRGRDCREGGARYSQFLFHVADRGLQDTTDSLIAIKKVVFEDKKATINDIKAALKNDFKGAEALRVMLKAAPKYGNDIDEVDDLFDELSVWLQDRIFQEKNPFGTPLWSGRSGAVAHVSFGKMTGALPNGRIAWAPLADGFLSPAQGADENGPTAVFNSASKADHNINSVGSLMNMKFEKALFKDPSRLANLSSMIETYFGRGGYHIQLNFLDPELLKKAQETPEQYSHLLVRVAGYSAYFVDLPTNVQEEIMVRTYEDID